MENNLNYEEEKAPDLSFDMDFSKNSSEQEDEKCASDRILDLPTYLIIPNRSQPRSSFNGNGIIKLADSIKRYGILQPLTVRKPFRENSGYYELIAGERRLRAAKLLGLRTVPCVLLEVNDGQSAELAIIENLLRENLNIFEQAQAFKSLIENFSLTQEEVALRVSLSQSAVANKLRLLKLSDEEQKMILDASLSERHARALLKITDIEQRKSVLRHICASKMNVSLSEAYIDYIIQKNDENSQNKQIESKPSETNCQKKIYKIDDFYSLLKKSLKQLGSTGKEAEIERQDMTNFTLLTIKIPT